MNPADLTAAQRALAEHTEALHKINGLETKVRDLEAQARADGNLIDLQRQQLASMDERFRVEQANTRRWIVYATKLMAGLESVQQIIGLNRTIAIEAAQQLSVEELDRSLKPEDLEALKRLAGTGATEIPRNDL